MPRVTVRTHVPRHRSRENLASVCSRRHLSRGRCQRIRAGWIARPHSRPWTPVRFSELRKTTALLAASSFLGIIALPPARNDTVLRGVPRRVGDYRASGRSVWWLRHVRARRHSQPHKAREIISMMRAILAGGGVGLLGAFVGFLYFLSIGPTSSGQMTTDQATMVGIAALLGGIVSLFFARRWPPASSWITTIVGWILGFHVFPPC